MSYTTIVASELLAAHLGEWAIVDCRFDLANEHWGREQYAAAHIPGAVYASLSDDLAGARTGRNGRHPLPAVDALAATFGRLGIDRSTQVVVYDQDVGMYASRLWWSLRYLGHDAVALLDGGWAKWTQEGRAVRSGHETRPPGTFTPDVRSHMLAGVDELTRAEAGSIRLIDARGPERYEGRVEPIDRVAGHIPGARNHYYRWNVAEETGTLLPPHVLHERFAAALGDRTPAGTVMYCGSGVSACHNLLAMEHAGLGGSRLYVGSWSEWSSDPGRPVEKGSGGS